MNGLRIVLGFIFVALVALLLLRLCDKPRHDDDEEDYPIAEIQVISSRTGQPIEGAKVSIDSNDELTGQVTLTTDRDGLCHFEYEDSAFVISRLLASKSGYSGALLQNLTLADFYPRLIVPLDEMERCNTMLDNGNGDQGNHAVRDFNLGNFTAADRMQFKFQYYTDCAADHIMVYDGSSQDVAEGKAELLFDYDGATDTTSFDEVFSVMLPKDGQPLKHNVVCVIVDKGTNWGYYVHCPIGI
ncbi:MAG: hypothetical protein K6G08_06850 [Prevotella sp.]|nr:hypothetical protein [Prevotella sp.]